MTPSKSRDEKQMIQQDQIAAMREAQMEGMDRLPTVEANRNPKYKIRADEANGYVHLYVANKHYQSTTKEIQLEERIIMIHKAQFQQKIDEKYFAPYDIVEVIHDPRQNAPKTYELGQKEGQVKIAEPKPSPNAELNERVKALKAKEQELIDKQTELEQREAKLAQLESAIPESLTKTKQPNP